MERPQTTVGYYTDEELIQRVLQQETALFEILIRRYNSLLYKLARTYGLNHQDTEDVMQETHVAAYTQLSSFHFTASYKTWITKILLHKCYHKIHYGAAKYETPAELPDARSLLFQSPEKLDTEKRVLNKELAGVLEQSLLDLSLAYRQVFVLREIEGFSTAETAALLQLTPTNVKARLSRAKTMLQKQLEQHYTSADLFEFHLKYCDKIVHKVFQKI